MIKLVYEIEDGCYWRTSEPITQYFKNEEEIKELKERIEAGMDRLVIIEKTEE